MSTVSIAGAESPFVLTLDIGSSSSRAIVFDSQGRMLEGGWVGKSHHLRTGPDGMVVVNSADELLEAVFQCLDEVLAKLKPISSQIAGVGSCTFVSNVLGVDNDGNAITPVYTYADSQPTPDVNTLCEIFDEGAVHQRVGTFFHPSYLPARFLWLKRTQPDLFSRVVRWMSIGEYMILKLFGKTAVSYSVASWTGLLNRYSLNWDDTLLSYLPIRREQLSPLVDVGDTWKGLSSPYAERWSVLKNVPWFPAVGDGATANIGSGCISPNRVAITMGTSSAVRVVHPGNVAKIPKGLWSYWVDRELSLVGGALSEGGGVYDWLLNTLRIDSNLDIQTALNKISPDSHGLTFLPLLAGERSPGWKGKARGALIGLSMANSALEILRAGMEGVAYRIGLIYHLLEPSLPSDALAIANGGALLNSPVWVKMIADVLGRTVIMSQVEESSARGSAMLTLRSLGIVPDLDSFPQITGEEYKPNIEYYERYQEAMQRQKSLYEFLNTESYGE
ncbi:MAG: gluconokinase [Anaerolineales bacterium]|nr:gluconokinase [Anaerolineales bacterium]